jgi:hypothetical protein
MVLGKLPSISDRVRLASESPIVGNVDKNATDHLIQLVLVRLQSQLLSFDVQCYIFEKIQLPVANCLSTKMIYGINAKNSYGLTFILAYENDSARQEEKAFTFDCLRFFLGDRKKLFKKILMCQQ